MKEFIGGVAYYTKATAEIGFPEDDICCHWCPLMGSEINPKREYCRKTGEYLLAPRHTIGTYSIYLVDKYDTWCVFLCLVK